MIHRSRKETDLSNVDKSNNKKKTVFISQKNIKDLPQLTKTVKVDVVYINTAGESINSDTEAVAKQVQYLKGSKYYILIGQTGSLFNPNKDEIKAKAAKGRRTLKEFEMKEVPKECFEKYQKFLKTKNNYQLGQAEIARGR